MLRLPASAFLLPLLAVAQTVASQTVESQHPAPPTAPTTRAEASDYTATSSGEDLQRFVDACVRLPHGGRLSVEVAGKTHEGRGLLLVRAALPGHKAPLRAFFLGGIHSGEVEGKEALQMLLREIALGEHSDLLAEVELWCLPNYNADGNEALGPQNRPGQNGPELTGKRANAQGLDLNRDFIKAEAPETRTLLALLARLDPHLLVDLHTTNGSYHGYHLTYAPCLSPNADRDLDRLTRTLLTAAAARMQRDHGFATFDYGNFERREANGQPATGEAGERGFYTYDHRPRYGINYYGLRNRLAVLSEAYSYCDFATRVRATRAFVLVLLQELAARRESVLRHCHAADQQLLRGEPATWFGYDTGLGFAERLPVLVGAVDKLPANPGGSPRFARNGDGVPEVMPVVRRFAARAQRVLPFAWAIREPTPEVVALLQRHGIEFSPVQGKVRAPAEQFAVQSLRKPKRPYQGHQELVLEGSFGPAELRELPPGTLLVPAKQRLGRLAAMLLEPDSEDSLSTWNYFEAQSATVYPVWRLLEAPR